MSNPNTVHSHELRVVFEEDENSYITWQVMADSIVERAENLSGEELASAGAPLSMLGIKVLQQLLTGQVIELALNKADNYRWRDLFSRISDSVEEPPEETVELQAVH